MAWVMSIRVGVSRGYRINDRRDDNTYHTRQVNWPALLY